MKVLAAIFSIMPENCKRYIMNAKTNRIFSSLFLLIVMIPSLHAKTTLAVYDLKASNLLAAEEVLILTSHLTSLVTKSGKYDKLDRSRMSEILQEQGFQQSGCTSDACAMQAGQLLGV